jgi:type I restriction enzyme R subunit
MDIDTMKSLNFEFLRAGWPELAALGGFGEAYAFSDPPGSLIKLRVFAEQLVEWVYAHLRLPRSFRPDLVELLVSSSFKSVTPGVVQDKLHTIRKSGNPAVHGNRGDTRLALRTLRDAFDVAKWFYLTYGGGRLADLPAFTEPKPANPDGGELGALRNEKRVILERYAVQEAQLQQMLSELQQAREKAQRAEQEAAAMKAAQAAAVEAGRRSADALAFDEWTTRRRLIDTALMEAGWDVGIDGASTDDVRQEVTLEDGRADYLLMNGDDTALAVVEAKKTAIDPEAGRKQAELYADRLEVKYGVRPIIYCTNGPEIVVWNQPAGQPPRTVYGFHSKETLQYWLAQRTLRAARAEVTTSAGIIDRLYQIEAVKRVVEKFSANQRKALIVLATGTGKTRVAVALCDALARANWVRRILFLCDRRELRKQARNTFKNLMPSLPLATIPAADDGSGADARIYLATYPAMMKCFQRFDVGYFDLVIADESHRSIYNRYRDLFLYFDALQVGLTATPVSHLERDTYDAFGCEGDQPTAHYGYREAVEQGFLVPFDVELVTTSFLREGIDYSKMSARERRELEAQEVDPAGVSYQREEIDRQIYNRDTNRFILRNLMENGIRDATGSRVGKSIIFARNHNHAALLRELFDEMYPQYGGDFCRVIDNYDPRAEDLIEDFKGLGNNKNLTVAISVDMLDTGIDVPEVVNLVFAKPVFSYVKFWQMIGRGTRLCPDLFGPGEPKTRFLIFDHWGNFPFFEEKYTPPTVEPKKSLRQLLFEGRVRLAEAALEAGDGEAFRLAISLVEADVRALPPKSIAVRERWREVQAVLRPKALERFEPSTVASLRNHVAPLMQWIDIGGHEEEYLFDHLVSLCQTERLRGSAKAADFRSQIVQAVCELPVNLALVFQRADVIRHLQTAEFWAGATVPALEAVRLELRDVMQYRRRLTISGDGPKVIDVREDPAKIERRKHVPKLEGHELAGYRIRVLKVLTDLFETSDTLKKIKAGTPVAPADLNNLVSMVLTQEPDLDLHHLLDYYPESAGDLAQAIRGIIGMDSAAVRERFMAFVRRHEGRLKSHQIKFLDLLQDHLAKYGGIEVARLYEAPFTDLHESGLDGVFPDAELADELLSVLDSFRPAQPGEPEQDVPVGVTQA